MELLRATPTSRVTGCRATTRTALLAVIRRHVGRWGTKANLNGRPRTTANGFEDRVSIVRQCSPESAGG